MSPHCVLIITVGGLHEGYISYYSPWSEREIWPFLKVETKEVTLTKIGVHACYMCLYLHEFFEPILIDQIF